MVEKVPMTAGGYAAVGVELKKRQSEDRPRIIAHIADARSHGDLSENAEYHAARERQSFIEGRVGELEDKIARAEVIDVTKLSGSVIKFGATVKLADEETEPRRLRDPVDVVNRGVADMGPIIPPLDGEVPFGVRGVHGPVEPFDLVLKGDRVASFQRPHDVGIVDPAITALGVVTLESAQDDVFAGDHEAPPRRFAARLHKIALRSV